jgi:proteic killer suppression protein
MDVRFSRDDLERLELEPGFDGGNSPGVVKAYRKRLQLIRSASDERAFYQLKSLHFEKLKGSRAGDYSMKLNDQWRLILRFEEGDGGKTVLVIGIEDYH